MSKNLTLEEYKSLKLKALQMIAVALEQLVKETQIKRAAERTLEVLKAEDAVESTLQVDTKVYDDLEIKETTSLFTWYNLK